MTKQEAIRFEKECDKLFSDALGTDCNASMALNGNLRVSFNANYVNVSKYDLFTIDWVDWCGCFNELLTITEIIQKTIDENREKVELLMESYGMNFD